MSASTSWWYCGSCGFKNHPRIERDEKGVSRPVDFSKCEQCGGSADHKESVDYTP
jgi:ribosomal protein S27AE